MCGSVAFTNLLDRVENTFMKQLDSLIIHGIICSWYYLVYLNTCQTIKLLLFIYIFLFSRFQTQSKCTGRNIRRFSTSGIVHNALIGALDGKHVASRCPHNGGSPYFSYLRCHSVVLFAPVHANFQFIQLPIHTLLIRIPRMSRRCHHLECFTSETLN